MAQQFHLDAAECPSHPILQASQGALLTLDMRNSSSVRRAIEVKESWTGCSRLSGAATAALMIADCGATLIE